MPSNNSKYTEEMRTQTQKVKKFEHKLKKRDKELMKDEQKKAFHFLSRYKIIHNNNTVISDKTSKYFIP